MALRCHIACGPEYKWQERVLHCVLLVSCFRLENSTGRGAWWATVHGVAKSPTGLSNFMFTFTFQGGVDVRGIHWDCPASTPIHSEAQSTLVHLEFDLELYAWTVWCTSWHHQ